MFEQFGLSCNFLDLHPQQCSTDEGYRNAVAFLKDLNVVNDTAERGVALIEEYNNALTRDEDQK